MCLNSVLPYTQTALLICVTAIAGAAASAAAAASPRAELKVATSGRETQNI